MSVARIRMIAITIVLVAFFIGTLPMRGASAREAGSGPPELALSARSAILMDADSGTIIFEKNSHQSLPPASLTKIMTMLLVMEAIEDGKLKWTDQIQASEYASSMGGSQIFLEPGERMTVEDLMKGVAMASGNDASVVLAEAIAGSEAEFVKLMNEKAQQLGMKDTVFENCNGLPSGAHVSSAHDIALMSRELLKYEGITRYTGMYQDYLRKDSPKPFWLVNTNKLVRFYQGVDGLKTGYTSEAKFCLSATARRDQLRVIAVVMGEPSTKARNAETSQLFDYAFAQYTSVSLYRTGDPIGVLNIEKGAIREVPLVAKRPYTVLLRKGDAGKGIRQELVLDDSVKAPVRAGDPIGKLMVYRDNDKLAEFTLEVPVDVARANWWTLLKRSTGQLFMKD